MNEEEKQKILKKLLKNKENLIVVKKLFNKEYEHIEKKEKEKK